MTRGRDLARALRADLVVVRPHAGAHRVAVRAGLSVLVPLLALWALGETSWSIYAGFGAMTALYGRLDGPRRRLRMQAEVGLLLTVVTTAGVLVGTGEHRAWLAVPLAALLAGAVSLVAEAERWHPPGALFPVFAFTACASLPSTAADLVVACCVAGLSAGFAVVIGAAGAVLRREPGRRTPPAPPSPGRYRHRRWHVLHPVLAVLLAGTIATGVGIGHPYWAMVSAVVPFAARDFRAQLVRGLHRVVGTFLGLAVAAAMLALEPRGLALVVLITVFQVGAELLIGRNYALALTCVTPLALLMISAVSPVSTATLLVDRGLETLIGVGIGLVLGYLLRPVGPLGRRFGPRMVA